MGTDLNIGAKSLNSTMKKFGAPATEIRSYSKWLVLLRPEQVTLGAMVLLATEPAHAFAQLSEAAFCELAVVIRDLEQALQSAFGYDKINYLMLMMVDPDVHFHVIPRYAQTRSFADQPFSDQGWPGPPVLHEVNATNSQTNDRIITALKDTWSNGK